MPRTMVNMAKGGRRKLRSVVDEKIQSDALVNEYPYGLCLCLTHEECEKLDLDDGDVEIGDMIHLFAMAEVTSVNKSKDPQTGDSCTRIELQITHLGLEDEDFEVGPDDEGSEY